MDFFIATLFSLFSIVDPPGAIPVYVALTSDRPKEELNRIALNTSLYFLLILVSFFLAGSYILSFFGHCRILEANGYFEKNESCK